jgi:signal recognition particle receptor subunit beta
MATFDPQRGWIVVRIVYDGAALAGKTTSLRALGECLGRPLFSGDEAEGRTLYLDWLDFVGGRFEDGPIRCQVVTVPGQLSLARRRRWLLEGADAVVLVADSTTTAWSETRRAVDSLLAAIGERDPPVGLIVQANKRDHPAALPLADLQRELAGAGAVALMETVASEGHGIRETFVFAVRLALDRVRELERRGELPREVPDIDSGEELLAALRAAEAAEPGVPAARPAAIPTIEPEHALAELTAPGARSPSLPTTPRLPTSDVPSGGVWPPVEGRIVLHEAERSHPTPASREGGDWQAGDHRWQWHSYREDVFGSAAEARAALLQWARWHAGAHRLLSTPRAIALCEGVPGGWRLWQVVGRVGTLADQVRAAIAAGDAMEIASHLLAAARALLAADRELIANEIAQGADLENLAVEGERIVFTGFAPGPATVYPNPARTTAGATHPTAEPSALLRHHLAPLLEACSFHARADVPRVLDGIFAGAGEHRDPTAQALAAIVIGS